MAGLDRRKSTPFAAKTFLKALRGLFRWAAENSFVEKDPTEGVLLYTGLRRGDAAHLGRQHIRDDVITFRTTKTGQQVTIPLLPELAKIIDATKTGDLALIATTSGGPMTKESFGNWFRQACKAAGVPGAAHGLRKAGATRAANNGATEAELEAIFGWHGGRMASLYTRNADRVRLAREAMRKLRK
jgi:integrase